MPIFQIENVSYYSGAVLKVFIDGELVDTFEVPKEPQEGDTLETPAVTAALQNRDITNVAFVGTMVLVTTQATASAQ